MEVFVRSALVVFGLAGSLLVAAQARFPGGTFSTRDGDNTISLAFDSTGTVTSFVNGQHFSQGKYTTRADTLSFGTLDGPEGYGCTVGGKYTWSIADNRLTMKLVSDDCQVRINYLTAMVWTRG
jgi:hypothetical protein